MKNVCFFQKKSSLNENLVLHDKTELRYMGFQCIDFDAEQVEKGGRVKSSAGAHYFRWVSFSYFKPKILNKR